MVQAKKWILAHHFDGQPKDSDLELVEETLPALKDGGMMACVQFSWPNEYMFYVSFAYDVCMFASSV